MSSSLRRIPSGRGSSPPGALGRSSRHSGIYLTSADATIVSQRLSSRSFHGSGYPPQSRGPNPMQPSVPIASTYISPAPTSHTSDLMPLAPPYTWSRVISPTTLLPYSLLAVSISDGIGGTENGLAELLDLLDFAWELLSEGLLKSLLVVSTGTCSCINCMIIRRSWTKNSIAGR